MPNSLKISSSPPIHGRDANAFKEGIVVRVVGRFQIKGATFCQNSRIPGARFSSTGSKGFFNFFKDKSESLLFIPYPQEKMVCRLNITYLLMSVCVCVCVMIKYRYMIEDASLSLFLPLCFCAHTCATEERNKRGRESVLCVQIIESLCLLPKHGVEEETSKIGEFTFSV